MIIVIVFHLSWMTTIEVFAKGKGNNLSVRGVQSSLVLKVNNGYVTNEEVEEKSLRYASKRANAVGISLKIGSLSLSASLGVGSSAGDEELENHFSDYSSTFTQEDWVVQGYYTTAEQFKLESHSGFDRDESVEPEIRRDIKTAMADLAVLYSLLSYNYDMATAFDESLERESGIALLIGAGAHYLDLESEGEIAPEYARDSFEEYGSFESGEFVGQHFDLGLGANISLWKAFFSFYFLSTNGSFSGTSIKADKEEKESSSFFGSHFVNILGYAGDTHFFGYKGILSGSAYNFKGYVIDPSRADISLYYGIRF